MDFFHLIHCYKREENYGISTLDITNYGVSQEGDKV
jgi:hypothetical protein